MSAPETWIGGLAAQSGFFGKHRALCGYAVRMGFAGVRVGFPLDTYAPDPSSDYAADPRPREKRYLREAVREVAQSGLKLLALLAYGPRSDSAKWLSLNGGVPWTFPAVPPAGTGNSLWLAMGDEYETMIADIKRYWQYDGRDLADLTFQWWNEPGLGGGPGGCLFSTWSAQSTGFKTANPAGTWPSEFHDRNDLILPGVKAACLPCRLVGPCPNGSPGTDPITSVEIFEQELASMATSRDYWSEFDAVSTNAYAVNTTGPTPPTLIEATQPFIDRRTLGRRLYADLAFQRVFHIAARLREEHQPYRDLPLWVTEHGNHLYSCGLTDANGNEWRNRPADQLERGRCLREGVRRMRFLPGLEVLSVYTGQNKSNGEDAAEHTAWGLSSWDPAERRGDYYGASLAFKAGLAPQVGVQPEGVAGVGAGDETALSSLARERKPRSSAWAVPA